MEIIEKRLAELTPYKNNPRKNDQAVDAVAASIKAFGFKVPIVIDRDGVIVCGHTRAKAAKKLKLESVPCVVADDLTEEEIKAFRLADNKVGELAEWDLPALDLELADLDFDMSDFGFDDVTNPDQFGESFSLPSGDKPEKEQITIFLQRTQRERVLQAFKIVEPEIKETFGNENISCGGGIGKPSPCMEKSYENLYGWHKRTPVGS